MRQLPWVPVVAALAMVALVGVGNPSFGVGGGGIHPVSGSRHSASVATLPAPSLLRDSGGSRGPLTSLSPRSPTLTPGVQTSVAPYVARTLTLWNDSLRAGNFVGANGLGPSQLLYDPNRGEEFAATSSGVLSVVSDSSDAVQAEVALPGEPSVTALAYDNRSHVVLAATSPCGNPGPCPAAGTVFLISDTTNTPVGNLSVGDYPLGIAYDGGRAGQRWATRSGLTVVAGGSSAASV